MLLFCKPLVVTVSKLSADYQANLSIIFHIPSQIRGKLLGSYTKTEEIQLFFNDQNKQINITEAKNKNKVSSIKTKTVKCNKINKILSK